MLSSKGEQQRFTDYQSAARIEQMSQRVLPPATNIRSAAPILKWAGGKGALLSQFAPYFPKRGGYARYLEPFLGGGAVFFYLEPEQSFLFDLNPELIEVYTVLRDNAEGLIEALRPHYNDRDYFYKVRAQDSSSLMPVERAARLIFLNRTCYNGLYRVNRQGRFNVPFGDYKNPTICDAAGLRAASAALQTATLKVADFEIVLEYAQADDLIYFDPPYHPLSRTSSFTSYTSDGFTSVDQRRLANIFTTLDARGCLLMLSNSDVPLIRDLYQDFHIYEINARRVINSKGNGRGVIKELLVTNFVPLLREA
jgi:DNA adenine methylase